MNNQSITIDTTKWAQKEKNLLQAAAVMVLHAQGVTYDKIYGKDPNVTVDNPSQDITSILTTTNVKNQIDTIMSTLAIANAAAKVEADARDLELDGHEFTNIKLDQVNNKIDSIENLVQLKVFLKKFVRYMVARGVIR